MRHKSERIASKKAKASPEKKVEKVKRTRSRRKKQSTSSENESAEEKSPVRNTEQVEEENKTAPITPVKDGNPEDTQDQVWRVKTSEDGHSGEVKKLKICLTRPPSTPEREKRSPRSRRKHSRATSSSDTPSLEGSEEKKKKHRRKTKEPKDESDKNDSQTDEPEDQQAKPIVSKEKGPDLSEPHVSTTDEGLVTNESEPTKEVKPDKQETDADTTVVSSNDEVTAVSPAKTDVSSAETSEKPVQENPVSEAPTSDTSKEEVPGDEQDKVSSLNEEKDNKDSPEEKDKQQVENTDKYQKNTNSPQKKDDSSPNNKNIDTEIKHTEDKNDKTILSDSRKRSPSVDKSEVLELHPDESKCDSDTEADKSKENAPEDPPSEGVEQQKIEVSIKGDKETGTPANKNNKTTNETGVVENLNKSESTSRMTIDATKESKDGRDRVVSEPTESSAKDLTRSNSTQDAEAVHNGQAAPIVVSRKRRWGSRPLKITTQKSITISTDILKDIIPDVKPVEFDEVIEDKKPKREVCEKVERPVLPKIVIDNSENVDYHRKDHKEREEKKDKIDIVKPRESLATNRKISIVKDSDSIIARPPSPPRHKQSCILYITNLVRPFTLPQLKNLLQRTGRIVENGFWIDRIKSKCYVIYETEDQAVETRHALHGVTWPVSNPKSLQVDFSTQEAFDIAKSNEDTDNAQTSTIPGTVEDWLREQDMKRERGDLEKPWERKAAMREWDVGKNDKDKEKEKLRRDEKPFDKRRHRSIERSPEPARKFKKKEEEAPAKLLDDLFRKTKTTPCIYWLPLSAETIAVKEEQRRQHMAEHERRLLEQRRPHRRH